MSTIAGAAEQEPAGDFAQQQARSVAPARADAAPFAAR